MGSRKTEIPEKEGGDARSDTLSSGHGKDRVEKMHPKQGSLKDSGETGKTLGKGGGDGAQRKDRGDPIYSAQREKITERSCPGEKTWMIKGSMT